MSEQNVVSVLVENITEYRKIGETKPRTSMMVEVGVNEDGYKLQDPRVLALYTAGAYNRVQETIDLIEQEMPELIDKVMSVLGDCEDKIEVSLASAENLSVILRDALLILKDGKM